MKINLKMLVLLTVLICICCTGSAYARSEIGLTFNPAPPYWPGEKVTVTAISATPPVAGASILIFGTAGFSATGYTDTNGIYTGVITMPYNVYQAAQNPPWGNLHDQGKIVICAVGNTNGAQIDFQQGNMDMYSVDYYVPIVQSNPNTQIPEFPSVVIPVAAILGLVVIFGRRKK